MTQSYTEWPTRFFLSSSTVSVTPVTNELGNSGVVIKLAEFPQD